MNSFNNISKVKYTRNQQEVVALKEYIIFDDEALKEKYVILKMANNLNQRLYEIKVEISQYNEHEELVEKTIIARNIKVEENDEFVPNAKLKVNYLCKTISFKLISARFERLRYENGQFFDIAHKFEAHQATLPPVKQAPIVEVVKPKEKKKKRKFSAKESYGKNKAKFPKVFNALVGLVSVGFVLGTVVLYRYSLQGKEFTVNNVDYRVINSKTIAISAYDGFDSELVVPASVDGKKVVRILTGAFKNSKVQKVTIKNDDFIIQNGAFNNCDLLKEIHISTKAKVLEEAFVDCDNLKRVYMPKTDLNRNVFDGSTELESLVFANTKLESLKEAFVLDEQESVYIKKLSTTMNNIPVGFLDNTKVGALDISDNCKVGYGNYGHVDVKNYQDNGTLESIDGDVVAINAEDKKLLIDESIVSLDVSKFANELTQIQELVINNYSPILTSDLYYSLINLKALEIYDISVLDDGILSVCTSINSLTTPVPNKYPLSKYLNGVYNIKTLKLTGYGYIDGYLTANLPQLENIYLSKDIVVYDSSIFANSYNVKNVEVSLFDEFKTFIDNYPAFVGARNITINPFSTYLPDEYFQGLPNVERIKVNEGVEVIGSKLISDSRTLTSIELPNTVVAYNSFPVIGSNNIRLTNVSYSANGQVDRYQDFNESYEYTKQLTVTNFASDSNEFFEGVTKLTKLSIHGDSVKTQGLLSNNKSITDLTISANSLSTYFSDLYFKDSNIVNNGKVPTTLTTLTIDCSAIPENYLEGLKGVENIYFKSAFKIPATALKEISGVKKIYIPKSCELTEELLSVLNDSGAKIYFEAAKVEYSGSHLTGVKFSDL